MAIVDIKQHFGTILFTNTIRKKELNLSKIISIVVISSWCLFAAIIAYNITIYNQIPVHWQIAIVSFIFLLPLSFFLQALLNERALTEEIRLLIEKGLSDAYLQYIDYEHKHDIVSESPPFSADISDSEKDRRIKEWYKKDKQFYRKYDPEKIVEFLQSEIKDILIYRAFKKGQAMLEEEYLVLFNTYKTIANDYQNNKLDITSEELKNVNFLHEKAKLDKKRQKICTFDLTDYIDVIVNQELLITGVDFRSYILPLSFFMFIYFTGFLITLPLINSVFTGHIQNTFIPLFQNNEGIPLIVIQWGFLGGFVYTSISLLLRFLRKDIVPRVYFNSSFRLLLSAVVAIIIYFFYMLGFGNSEPKYQDTPPQLLLLCFAAGVAPITFLIRVADNQFSKIYKGWRRRDTAGNRNITQIEGINSITSERLSEEGIDYIQHLALSEPLTLSRRTKFDFEIVYDWKDQAILFLLTADISVQEKIKKEKKKAKYLNDILNEKMGIKRFSQLNIQLNKLYNESSVDSDENKKEFFKGLELPENDFRKYDIAFEIILKKGKTLLEEEKKLSRKEDAMWLYTRAKPLGADYYENIA